MKIDADKLRSFGTKFDRFLVGRTAEIIVRLFVMGTMIACFVVFVRQDEFSTCQGRYDQAYAIYARNTREVNAEANMRRDELNRAFADALKRKDQQTLADIDAAYERYFKAAEAARKQQELNPPPELPEAICGKR